MTIQLVTPPFLLKKKEKKQQQQTNKQKTQSASIYLKQQNRSTVSMGRPSYVAASSTGCTLSCAAPGNAGWLHHTHGAGERGGGWGGGTKRRCPMTECLLGLQQQWRTDAAHRVRSGLTLVSDSCRHGVDFGLCLSVAALNISVAVLLPLRGCTSATRRQFVYCHFSSSFQIQKSAVIHKKFIKWKCCLVSDSLIHIVSPSATLKNWTVKNVVGLKVY